MFNIEKLIQTCSYLIKKHGFKMNYTKLIKLLYLADKESLDVTNKSITGDSYVSMKNGPVLSRLYDLIRNKHGDREEQMLWNSRFTKDGFSLVAVTDRIPDGELSDFEKDVLDSVGERFKNSSFGDMIDYVHKNCPEWKDPHGSAVAISMEDILKGMEKSKEDIDYRLKEKESFEEEDRIFQSLASA
jgi:uncharacterized phage-associated protein